MKIIVIVAALFIAFSLTLVEGQTYTQSEIDSTVEELDLNESEVLGYLIAMNEREVAGAEIARQKNSHPEVVAYAQQLISDHAQNLEDTRKLAKDIDAQPQENASITRFRENRSGILANLSQLEGGAFSNAYMDFMVREHIKALEMIDKQFLENADHPQLKGYLKATRMKIAKHLAEAERIKDDLNE